MLYIQFCIYKMFHVKHFSISQIATFDPMFHVKHSRETPWIAPFRRRRTALVQRRQPGRTGRLPERVNSVIYHVTLPIDSPARPR
jgi:hypothetical protein